MTLDNIELPLGQETGYGGKNTDIVWRLAPQHIIEGCRPTHHGKSGSGFVRVSSR